MTGKLLILSLLAVVTTAAAQPAAAPAGQSETGQPQSYDFMGEAYVVSGYRSARFGMTATQVRAAIAKDFPRAKVSPDLYDPVNRVTVISALAGPLDPGVGAATVSYVLGAESGKLIHVNVDWLIEAPTPGQRAAFIDAGAKLLSGLVGYNWKLLTVARGVPVAPNSLLLFAATGEAGGAVEVRIDGIAYTAVTPTGMVASPAPSGPATLHLAFAQKDANPDA
jgi:hypothetical protein